ncbi:MAG: lysylphosphatidylglycerol synthase transmembrane domain-containing protein [Candidatus Woesearchaeota archaeon]
MKKKQIIKNVIFGAIALGLIWLLLSQISLKSLFETLKNADIQLLFVGFVLYAITYLFRTFRFKALLNDSINVNNLFKIVSLHALLNNLIPARLGELSFVYFTKKIGNIKSAQSISVLIICRVMDFTVSLIIFSIALLNIGEIPSIMSSILKIMSVFLLLMIMLLFILIFTRYNIHKIAFRFCNLLKIDHYRFISFLLAKIKEIIEEIKNIKSNKKMVQVIIYSILIWASFLTSFYFIILSLNMQISLWIIMIAFIFLMWASILPIHSFGGFGTSEGAWAIAMIALGTGKEQAIISGFSVHILMYVFVIILCIFAIPILRKIK